MAVRVPVLTGEVTAGLVDAPPLGLQHWSFQLWPDGQEGVGGDGLLGTQQPWSWCHHQEEGHEEPAGGEGGFGCPP